MSYKTVCMIHVERRGGIVVLKRYAKNESGLTLVEVLASIVILSLIVVTFLSFFINSARTTEISGDNLDASFIAQEYMEEIYNIVANNHQSLESIRTDILAIETLSSVSQTTYAINESRGSGSIQVEQAKDENNQVISRLLKVVVSFRVSGGKEAKLETRMIYEEVDAGA